MSPKTRATPVMEKIQATLDTLVASNANLTSKMDKLDALSKKMDKLNTSVNSIGARLESTEANLLLQTNKVAAQELVIKALDHKLEEALNAIDNLENQSRRRNLRLLHLPEKSEAGYNMEAYLAKTLSALLSIPLKELDIEFAHRLGPLVEQSRPRTVIFKLHHLQKKISIMEAVKSTLFELKALPGVKLRITEDMSVRRRKLRDQYWPLREQLHGKNVKTRVRDPGTLLVWIGNEQLKFGSLEAATTALKVKFPDLK